MSRNINVCGTICTECGYYPDDCHGCKEEEGKIFWTEYTGEPVCGIYQCCLREKGYVNCSQCKELPCARYDLEDPTKSSEENQEDLRRQLDTLEEYRQFEELVNGLTRKDQNQAYANFQILEKKSRESDAIYPFFGTFAEMISSSNSYVRTRGLRLIAANVRWDADNRMDEIVDEYVRHISDEKPITARQCIQSLPEIAQYKPELKETIVEALYGAKVGHYADSMRPLVQKDIAEALKKIR